MVTVRPLCATDAAGVEGPWRRWVPLDDQERQQGRDRARRQVRHHMRAGKAATWRGR